MRISTKLSLLSFAFFTPMIIVVVVANAPPVLAVLAFVTGAACAAYIYFKLEPLVLVTDAFDQLIQGNFDQAMLPEEGEPDIRKLAEVANALRIQYEDSLRNASDLAAGRIKISDVEERVLKSGALSDADEAPSSEGALGDAMVELSNQMRRLTIQARVISKDQLSSPLLDERVPGELGDAFGLMVRNLRSLKDRARQIADGDLTGRAEGTGDLTEAFNKMADRFEDLAAEITRAGVHISSSAEEILAVLREQEMSASHQASGVEETQRTMETLLSSAKRIAESAQTVFKSAEKTQANNRIVGERIAELKGHTERIGEILEVIKSIADRSDLLALNASLEGMRAGEAGKGFTLVAAEMRRLAESIKESVGDIKELLNDIRESALSSVMATEEGSNLSEKTTESALKITLITQQQQSGTEQVTQSMDELSALINHGVSGMRQVTVAADELVTMAEDLRVVVEDFETGGPSASREFKTVTKSARRSPVRPLSEISDSFERERAARPRPSSESTEAAAAVVEEFASSAAPVEKAVQKPSRDAQSRETLAMTPVAGASTDTDDPPTVELTGLSDEVEKEMLAEAIRTGSSEEE